MYTVQQKRLRKKQMWKLGRILHTFQSTCNLIPIYKQIPQICKASSLRPSWLWRKTRCHPCSRELSIKVEFMEITGTEEETDLPTVAGNNKGKNHCPASGLLHLTKSEWDWMGNKPRVPWYNPRGGILQNQEADFLSVCNWLSWSCKTVVNSASAEQLSSLWFGLCTELGT